MVKVSLSFKISKKAEIFTKAEKGISVFIVSFFYNKMPHVPEK